MLGHAPFFHDGIWSSFRERKHGRPVEPAITPGWRFVGSLQTHDQIGNRANGDRLSGHLVSLGRAAIGAALLLTSPYTPMLFMGEEWGASTPWQYFTDHGTGARRGDREGRQAEFAEHGWAEREVPDPQDPETVGVHAGLGGAAHEPHARPAAVVSAASGPTPDPPEHSRRRPRQPRRRLGRPSPVRAAGWLPGAAEPVRAPVGARRAG